VPRRANVHRNKAAAAYIIKRMNDEGYPQFTGAGDRKDVPASDVTYPMSLITWLELFLEILAAAS
jgi:hypothetical protein